MASQITVVLNSISCLRANQSMFHCISLTGHPAWKQAQGRVRLSSVEASWGEGGMWGGPFGGPHGFAARLSSQLEVSSCFCYVSSRLTRPRPLALLLQPLCMVVPGRGGGRLQRPQWENVLTSLRPRPGARPQRVHPLPGFVTAAEFRELS